MQQAKSKKKSRLIRKPPAWS